MTRREWRRAAACVTCAAVCADVALASCNTPMLPTETACVTNAVVQVGSQAIAAGPGSTPCSNPSGDATLEDSAKPSADSGAADVSASDVSADVSGRGDGAGPGSGVDSDSSSDSDSGLDDAAGGTTVPATIAAGTTDLWFSAQASMPAGTWVVTVTAAGALSIAPLPLDAGPQGVFTETLSSEGAGTTFILVPLSSAATTFGPATITTTIGGVTQQFLFDVSAAISPSAPPCISASSQRALSWVVLPAPPATIGDACAPDGSEDGGCGSAEGEPPAVPTAIVDVAVSLVACDPLASLASAVIGVSGTGGLEPTAPTFTTDSIGNGYFELRGPALQDTVIAVLTYQIASTTVCVEQSDLGPCGVDPRTGGSVDASSGSVADGGADMGPGSVIDAASD